MIYNLFIVVQGTGPTGPHKSGRVRRPPGGTVLWSFVRGMVADVFGRDHENDVFGDVGGVVADAFEVAGDENEVQRRLDRRRRLEHVGQQLAEDLRLQRV